MPRPQYRFGAPRQLGPECDRPGPVVWRLGRVGAGRGAAAVRPFYAAVLAIINTETLLFEAGGNSGLTRYFHEASQHQARGTFYLQMQRRRAVGALFCAAALLLAGPRYARATHFATLAAEPWLFGSIAAIVTATLLRLLAHYGLLAMFEVRAALLFQQAFQLARAVVLAAVALQGGRLGELVYALLVVITLEAVLVHTALWRQIRAERAELPPDSSNGARRSASSRSSTKGARCSAGAPSCCWCLHRITRRRPSRSSPWRWTWSPDPEPDGHAIGQPCCAEYLSQTPEEPWAQALAASRVTKFSSLLYCFSIGAAALLLPWFVPTVYGSRYAGAAWLALLVLLPAAFENWVRGCCSPVLLRNARYRDLMRVNILQTGVTLTVLAAAHRLPMSIALVAIVQLGHRSRP